MLGLHRLVTLTVSSTARYLSMMDFVDLARRTSSSTDAVCLEELGSAVRAGLEDIVAGRHENLPTDVEKGRSTPSQG